MPKGAVRLKAAHRRAMSVAAMLALPAACLGLTACGDSGSPAASPAASHLVSGASVSEARANTVTVSPAPGTEDASPATQISFLGPRGTKVSGVSVVGSKSGDHSGKLEPYSTHTGESFVVNRPFEAGEQVAVRALVGVGTPSRPVTSVFRIARQASVSESQFPRNPGNPAAVQHFASDPYASPSTVTITARAPGAAPGYLFLAPYQGEGSAGPMIAQQDGTMVWSHALPPGFDATNFQVQRYRGRPVLTWWQGRVLQVGFGVGENLIYDSSYRQIGSVRAGNGYQADLHEIRLTDAGTAWIDMFDPIRMNLSAVKGAADGVLTDSVIQEIDVKTGLVMWEWHALGHIPLSDSYNPAPDSSYPWDYVHINSIDPGRSGDVLLSSRNTWALYDVNMRTGAFNWQLGGRHSSFHLQQGAKFYWQHDAEFQPGGAISVFDNGSTPRKEAQSRGLLLKPDFARRTVKLLAQFVNPSRTLLADAQGNLARLPGGRWLMGYGNLPDFTEYDSAGHVLLDGTLGRGVQDFRTFLSPWYGRPAYLPSVAARRSGSGVSVSTSWNGATGIASWQLLEGASPSAMAVVKTAAKSGFQMTFEAPDAAYVATRALGPHGETLSTSHTVRPR